MPNKYILFDLNDREDVSNLAKVIAALQYEGVRFKLEKDSDGVRIYFD
jgi:hypothetical protein